MSKVSPKTAEQMCFYCKRELRSVHVMWPGAKPSCGCAECLLMAAREARESVT